MNVQGFGFWFSFCLLSFFYFLFFSAPLYFPVLNSQRKKSSVSKIKQRWQWVNRIQSLNGNLFSISYFHCSFLHTLSFEFITCHLKMSRLYPHNKGSSHCMILSWHHLIWLQRCADAVGSALATPRNLLEMQMPGSHSRHTDSEALLLGFLSLIYALSYCPGNTKV